MNRSITPKHPPVRAPIERLSELHHQSIDWLILCCHGDQGEAEDLLQQAYVMVLEGKIVFEGRSQLKTWFFGVLRRLSQTHQRTIRRRVRLLKSTLLSSSPLSSSSAPLSSLPHLSFFSDLSSFDGASLVPANSVQHTVHHTRVDLTHTESNHPSESHLNPETHHLKQEQRQRIRSALNTLSRRQRQVIELVFYHGLTLEESAEVMSLNIGSARTHYARAKERLSQVIPRSEVDL